MAAAAAQLTSLARAALLQRRRLGLTGCHELSSTLLLQPSWGCIVLLLLLQLLLVQL
jgi:hypothetical protein